MYILNLTPHDVHILLPGGKTLTLHRSGKTARLETTSRPAQGVAITGGPDIPAIYSKHGPVTGLPEPAEDWLLLVSTFVAAHVRRPDVVSPGGLVRDGEGRVLGCRELTRWA